MPPKAHIHFKLKHERSVYVVRVLAAKATTIGELKEQLVEQIAATGGTPVAQDEVVLGRGEATGTGVTWSVLEGSDKTKISDVGLASSDELAFKVGQETEFVVEYPEAEEE